MQEQADQEATRMGLKFGEGDLNKVSDAILHWTAEQFDTIDPSSEQLALASKIFHGTALTEIEKRERQESINQVEKAVSYTYSHLKKIIPSIIGGQNMTPPRIHVNIAGLKTGPNPSVYTNLTSPSSLTTFIILAIFHICSNNCRCISAIR